MLGAIALAFAFPKAQQAWLAPLGAAGLFWAWERLSWKRAFFAGWFAGTIFFAINFSWFTYTVGSYVGDFAFAVVLIPALVEGFAVACAAALASAAFRLAPGWMAPAAAAAAFTVFEWLRSIGYTAVPFAQIGYTQTDTALRVFAPYAGCYGVTFVVMALGAYISQAVARRRVAKLAVAVAVLAVLWAGAYAAWPARSAAAPSVRVAAVQGSIPQTIKWHPENLRLAVQRYMAMSQRLQPFHPVLVVWPETVITTDLNDPAASGDLSVRFANLARTLNTTLVVGSLDRHWSSGGLQEYNALYTYAPNGSLIDVYDKRQLVPFVENLPLRGVFGKLPHADLIGRFAEGNRDAVIPAGPLKFAPLICWESAFADLVHAQIARGAQFLVVSTDDAWFGKSSGTYQHAQIAQMRAIETGEWVLQSASTGVSGLISPDGRWVDATGLDRQAVMVGSLGPPAYTFFSRIGPNPIAYAAIALYIVAVALGTALHRRNA